MRDKGTSGALAHKGAQMCIERVQHTVDSDDRLHVHTHLDVCQVGHPSNAIPLAPSSLTAACVEPA